jgi:hypothetical protein
MYEEKNKTKMIKIISKMIANNFSFESINGTELYIYILDEEDFNLKQSVLGKNIINIENIAN